MWRARRRRFFCASRRWPSYCLPIFTYGNDGRSRCDNITTKALTLFQIFYDEAGLTREDIFPLVYAMLHHPAYRTRYAENLKRDLPRIPFVGVAASLCDVAERGTTDEYMKDHATKSRGYDIRFFPLSAVETMQGERKAVHGLKAGARLDWRVEAMKLVKSLPKITFTLAAARPSNCCKRNAN